MNRRKAIRNAGLLLGYSISAPAIVGIMNGCKPDPGKVTKEWLPKFMNAGQVADLKAFVDHIIPKTDTPSASEVGVVEFIDEIMADYLPAEDQAMFKAGLERLNLNKKSFSTLTNKEQTTLMMDMEKVDIESLKQEGVKESFFTKMKGLIVTGYMLSEEIGVNHLAYDPIPQNYDGCIPLEQNGGVNWSL